MTEIERGVIDAFNSAAAEGKSTVDCYLAATAAWQARFPEQASCYARQAAVAIILRQRVKAYWRLHRREMHSSLPVERAHTSSAPTQPSSLRLDETPEADDELRLTGYELLSADEVL